MKRVAVFGLGYVGCVTAACLSRDGYQVTGVDIDRNKVRLVGRGQSPVTEPGLGELLRSQVAAGRFRATTDVAEAVHQSDLALIAVGTPSAADGSVETRAVERVVESVGESLRGTGKEYILVVRSTLLPGMLEERLLPCLAAALREEPGERVQLCNNPEFLRETTAIRDYDDPPFVVVGADDPAVGQEVLGLYAGIAADKLVTQTRTAAMLKYACNALHALKIGFANEIGTLSKAFGADGQEVMRIACQDTRLNVSPAYLRPGFAFGGSCLPKDVRALVRFAQREALRTELLEAILPSNHSHLERALRIIQDTGIRRIGLAGLSFKAGTDDLRESPQVLLAETLLGRGYELRILDPFVRVSGLVGSNLSYVEQHLPHLAALLVDHPRELLTHAELLIIATDVGDQLDIVSGGAAQVLDLRRDLVVADPEWSESAASSSAALQVKGVN